MELYKGKIGEIEILAKIEDGKIIVQEAYSYEAGLDMLVDKVEQAIPGDQKAYAEVLKAAIKAKLAAA